MEDDSLAKRLFWLSSGCLVGFWLGIIWAFGATPAEDAFILFRYSEHLALGHGIAWNPGEGPVEGATDFLWMVLISALTRLVGDPVLSSLLLGGAFVVATVYLLYWFFRRYLRLPFVVFSVAALGYLATPIFVHLVNGFSPPIFGFVLLASTVLFILVLERPSYLPTLLGWAVAMLLCGLTRPEGNLFDLLLIASYFLVCRDRLRSVIRPALLALGIGYAVPGLAYFLWRMEYFGLVWPLPFYLKGLYAGSRLGMLLNNVRDLALHLLVPVLALIAILVLPVRSERGSRTPALVAASALLLLGVYLLMSLSQNVVYRFQYPAVLLLLFLAAWRVGEWLRLERLDYALWSALALGAAILWFTISAIPLPEPADDLLRLGQSLRRHLGAGYTLATTEAGRLPFHSKWRTLDSYGLNDPTLAVGGFDYEHWKRYAPDLVLIHPGPDWDIYSTGTPLSNGGNRRSLMRFMRKDTAYELIAIVQRTRRRGGIRPGDYNLYFLSRRSPGYRELRRELLSIDGAHYAESSAAVATYLTGIEGESVGSPEQ